MHTETIHIPVSDGIEIVADLAGPRDAPMVILGHGGGQTRHSWDKAELQLAAAGYCAVNYDLRGHGDSGWSPDGRYTNEMRSADLTEIAKLARGPVALVGASMGGVTALIACTHGLDAAALVLVDIVPKLSLEGADKVRGFMGSAPDGFSSLEEAADAISAYYPDRPRPKDLSGLNKNLRLGEDGRYRWHWDPRMLQDMGGDPRHLLTIMDEADWTDRIPTLLVRGMKSDIVTEDGVEDLKRRIPALEIADIRGAGHMVAGDKNDEFNAAVIEFLTRVMPAK